MEKMSCRPCLFAIALILGVLYISCEAPKRVGNQNVAFLYKKEAPAFNPDYSVVHINDTLSELFFRVPGNQLLYARANSTSPFSAKVRLTYRLFDDFDARMIYDTASVILTDVENADVMRDLVGSIKFRSEPGLNYILEVTLADLNRNRQRKTFLSVEKTNINSRHNFQAKDGPTGIPLFRDHVKNNKVKVSYIFPTRDRLYVRYYNKEFGIAAPPYAQVNPRPFDYRADSVFEINMNERTAELEIQNHGFYHIQADSTINREGLTIFYFTPNFPEVKSLEEMIGPLRYITTKTEYDEIIGAENKKAALDKFWLNAAGNPDRARELISVFYNRVQDANLHFSSFIEGWKTDRGMIYIIFGPPNVLYKTSEAENWIYGEEQNMMSMTFNFFRVENPFSSNDFSLDRAPIYKTNWNRAVETWRSGRVY
jgi:GWxTD domain-containing protein